jgi:hypothetical protein
MWDKKLFCLHYWVKPWIQKTRPNSWFGVEYEWKCNKCNKVKYNEYENIPPEPNIMY